jgi:hypothetical protein
VRFAEAPGLLSIVVAKPQRRTDDTLTNGAWTLFTPPSGGPVSSPGPDSRDPVKRDVTSD